MQHPIFNYLTETDYLKYYEYEIQNRTAVSYPPVIRLVEIELKNTDENQIEDESLALVELMMQTIEENKWDITVLGPAKPPVAKIKNTHSRKIYLKGRSMTQLIQLYKSIDKSQFKSHIFFTPNPNNN